MLLRPLILLVVVWVGALLQAQTNYQQWINSKGDVTVYSPSIAGATAGLLASKYNWSSSPAGTLAIGSNVVTILNCPLGFKSTIDGTNLNWWIYVDSAGGDAQQPGEPVLVTAVNCPPGNASGTITFSAAYAHGAGYTLESGTGGIKEALIDGNQVRFDGVRGNNVWVEVTPKQVITLKAPLYWQSYGSRLDGSSLLECVQNMPCINVGDTNSLGVFAHGVTNTYVDNTFNGFWIRPAIASGASFNYTNWTVAPSAPATITAGTNNITLTIPTCPTGFWPLIPNQILWLEGTSGGLTQPTTYPPGTISRTGPGEFVTPTGGNCTPGAVNGTIIISQATPGLTTFAAHGTGYTLKNGAAPLIEDNSQGSAFYNLITNGSPRFSALIQNDNNQDELIVNPVELGGIACCTVLGIGPVSINAGIPHIYGGTGTTCLVDFNGNDAHMDGTVCQSFANFGSYLSTRRGGGLQHAHFSTVHFETGGINSLNANLGQATVIVDGGYHLTNDGGGDQTGLFPQFLNLGQDTQEYYLSIVDVTDGTKTTPMPIGYATVTNPNTNNVTVLWQTAEALAAKTINFELYRVDVTVNNSSRFITPYPGLCDGIASDGKCLVATSIDPATACDIHGVCSFVDTLANPSLTAATIQTGIVNANTLYSPFIDYFPGVMILSGNAQYSGDPTCISVNAPWLQVSASAISNDSTAGAQPSCMPTGGANNVVQSSLSGGNVTASNPQTALLFPERAQTQAGGVGQFLKGRFNFMTLNDFPTCIITWRDFNPAKTLAWGNGGSNLAGGSGTSYNRPSWDLGDTCTGVDANNSKFDMAIGSFHRYINVLPNVGGTNWTDSLDINGYHPPTFAFASLPVSPNGSIVFCSDCNGTCTANGGTGRTCFRENGSWTH